MIDVGSLVRVSRGYGSRSQDILGTVMRYQPIDGAPTATRRVAKIKLLVTTGIIWDFTLCAEDEIEVVFDVVNSST